MKNPTVVDDYFISSARMSEYEKPSEEENRLGSYSKLLSIFTTGKLCVSTLTVYSFLTVYSSSTACSNFSVQYNFQSVSIALIIMSASQCTLDDDGCKGGEQAAWVFSTASASVFVGAVVGQLTVSFVQLSSSMISQFVTTFFSVDGLCW